MSATRIKSNGGGYVNMPIPRVGEIDIQDIAHALSNQCRCAGWTKVFFSVAQHSCEVGTLCYKEAKAQGHLNPARAGLAGLLHDAPETYYQDIISPTKIMLGEAYTAISVPADEAVYTGLDVVSIMKENDKLVRWADLEMLASDMARWDVFGTIKSRKGYTFEVREHGKLPPPFILRFGNAIPMEPTVARNMFLTLYQVYTKEIESKRILVT